MSKCKYPSECIDSNSCALMHECAMDGPRLTERVQVGSTVYEKGTLAELAVAAVKRAIPVAPGAAAQGEVVRELTALDADMVWPEYDGETFHHSIDDAVDYEVDQAWPTTGPLELKLTLAKRIPTATIRIFNITENGHEWEIVPAECAPSTGDLGVGNADQA